MIGHAQEKLDGDLKAHLLRARSKLDFLGRPCSACEILRSYFLDIELGCSLAHRLKHVFKGRRVALDPTQRVDPGHNERTQVGADQTTFLELLDHRSDPLLEIKYRRSMPFVHFERSTKWVIREVLEPAQNR